LPGARKLGPGKKSETFFRTLSGNLSFIYRCTFRAKLASLPHRNMMIRRR
jgi:hypothetical protein